MSQVPVLLVTTQAPQTASTRSVAAKYEKALAEHGADSLSSIFFPKGRQEDRFAALTAPIRRGAVSVLDYGCGLGHLKPFLDARFKDVAYEGVDMVGAFVEADRRRYPGGVFRKIESYLDITESYDFIVLSGVFNLCYTSDRAANQALIHTTLTHLFSRTRVALAVDFMHCDVDFMQEGAHHQDGDEIANFFRRNLTSRLTLDFSYLPYEFCICAWKEQTVVRPANVYIDCL